MDISTVVGLKKKKRRLRLFKASSLYIGYVAFIVNLAMRESGVDTREPCFG